MAVYVRVCTLQSVCIHSGRAPATGIKRPLRHEVRGCEKRRQQVARFRATL